MTTPVDELTQALDNSLARIVRHLQDLQVLARIRPRAVNAILVLTERLARSAEHAVERKL